MAVFVVVVVTSVGAGDGIAKDKVSLPFTCSLDGGRLRVEPAREHSFPIVGQREQQAFTFCPAGEKGRCRTWMVHRFAVQCTGGRVTWPEIVAAAASHLQNRAVIENGQLLLRLGPRFNDGCAEANRGAGRSGMPPECQLAGYAPARGVMRSHILAMPRGFAPLGLVRARVMVDAEAPPKPIQVTRGPETEAGFAPAPIALPAVPRRMADDVVSEALEPARPATAVEGFAATAIAPTGPAAPAMVDQPPAPAKAVAAAPPIVTPPPIIITPSVIPPPVPPLPVAAPPGLALPAITPVAWTERAEAAGVYASREEASTVALEGFARFYALMLVATGLLTITGIVLRRRSRRVRRRAIGVSSGAGEHGDGPRAVALRDKAEGHITLISGALERLAMMAPLRNALARDLQASERRLAVVIAAISSKNGVEADAWTRARRRLERIAQDLDRLQNIADSAVSSLSGLHTVRALPRNKDEAYMTLGVSNGVSEAILKRLVEALRISWHPDLARNDADRELRDIRIKEINVAWDLITGKRESE